MTDSIKENTATDTLAETTAAQKTITNNQSTELQSLDDNIGIINADDLADYKPAKEILSSTDYADKLNIAFSDLEQLDNNSILNYGAKAQEQMTVISDQMLTNVKSKDIGPAGDMLGEMIAVLKGFDIKQLNPNKKQNFLDKLLGKAKPLVKFQQRYELVTEQVESIAISLEKHKETLLHDIKSLDKLYIANLEYFHNLEFYIAAGDKKLAQLDDETIPNLAAQASSSNNMLDAQKLQDLRANRDNLERRVHDLRLTRQVAMQSLPSIRLIQHNDNGLVTKINSTIINTIPLWRQQLAQAITIYRSNQAADTLKSATDLTNELLQANADNLNQANELARRQIERGVFDIETIEKANNSLIKTIEGSLQIATEGKKARIDALTRLEKVETDLKQALLKTTTSAE